MKFFMYCLASLLFILTSEASDCGNKEGSTFCMVKYVSIYDGDTFKVNIPKLHDLFGNKLSIRVKGVDTPELRGVTEFEKALGKKAKEFSKIKLEGAKRIDLVDCERGKYFRLACQVMIDDKNLADDLIKNGLGIIYEE